MLNSVSGASSGAYSTSTAQSQMVDQFFKKVDSNSDGKITKSELEQAIASDSVKISSGGDKASVDQIFKMLDTGNKGYISKQDAAAGLSKSAQTGSSASTGKSGGPPKGGGGGGGGSASTSVSLDPADTNQDGTVTAAEQVAYILKQYQLQQAAQQAQTSTYA